MMRNYADHTSYANSFAPLPELAPPSPKAINAPALDSSPLPELHLVHNIRNNLATTEKGVFDYIDKDLNLNNRVYKSLWDLYDTAASTEVKNTMERAAVSIANCSNDLVFSQLPTGESIFKGRYRCRNKLCPACGKALQAKRRNIARKWLDQNSSRISGLYFYTVVLTLEHNSEKRNYDYSPELTGYWKKLRNDRRYRDWWNSNISGSLWGMEVAKKNDSPHIHLHILLASPIPLHTTDFKQELEGAWNTITEGSYIVHLDRVYKPIYHDAGQHVGKKGRRYDKQYFEPGDPLEDLIPVLTESLKYTVKFHGKDLKKLGPQFVHDWINNKGRKFGTTGIFYGKGGMKPVTKKDLEDVEEDKATLIKSPATGRQFKRSQLVYWSTDPSNVEEVFIGSTVDQDTGEVITLEHSVKTIVAKDETRCRYHDSTKDWQKYCRMRFAPKNRNKNKPNLIQT